ncbi:MAG: glycosyltransferase family 2 protein [Clostridia bacterium]|nr:glycosyltransferase family 2 protein [Clostridia bacterium]
MGVIEWIIKIINRIWSFISFLYKYRTVYKVCGLFATRKFSAAKSNHKYAVLVAARNEEAVIENLIDSIKNQDYPREFVDVFVVADNCTDNTANLSRNAGAVCYERFDKEHRTKGYALQFLVEKIREDYGIESFEGYFIFDADNLLKKDYISRMNDAFDAGEKIITSYRNTKNFDDNWISASYAIHWLRTIRNEHRARSLFHLATRIQGTGFLFSNELIKDGWNYTSLTEDRAFCADAVAMGYRISYNNAAEFYDEQPTDIKIAMRQRIRWSKGHLQALAETGPKLFCHIFYTNGAANQHSENLTLFKKFINNIRLRFMSFDMLTVVLPKSLLSVIRKFIVYTLRIVLIIGAGRVFGVGYAPEFLRNILKFFGITPQFNNDFLAVLWLVLFALGWTISSYFNGVLTAAYIFIVENRRIIKIKWYKKLWFALTFPLFDIIGKISLVAAIFAKVEWKAIPHTNSTSIEEMESRHKNQSP